MPTPLSPPYSPARAIDLYFLEHRAKLLDIAAFVDRVARADPRADLRADPRMASLLDAVAILTDGTGERAKRIQLLFSDHTETALDAAPGKGAIGADPKYRGPRAHDGKGG